MIDTIGLNFFHVIIPEDIYSTWPIGGYRRKGKYINKWHCQTIYLLNSAPIKYTYYLYSRLLKIEFSLPHVIYGNNIQMIDNIKDAIDIANSKLPVIPGVPSVDLWTGIIYRLDPCYNHQVGELVPYYIDALQSLEYSHRKTGPYTTQGVQYNNKQVSTKFYNKEKKCGNPAAYENLRQEITFRREKVKEFKGKKKTTLDDITPDLLIQALENDLSELNLLGRSIGTADTTLSQLCKTEGEDAGIYYYGLLHANLSLTKERLISATKLHPRSMDRRLKKIVDAGIPLTITKHIEPLPPLVIDRDCIGDDEFKS